MLQSMASARGSLGAVVYDEAAGPRASPWLRSRWRFARPAKNWRSKFRAIVSNVWWVRMIYVNHVYHLISVAHGASLRCPTAN